MHQRIKRISCAPGKISITLDNGDVISSERKKSLNGVVSELLRQEFEDGQQEREAKTTVDKDSIRNPKVRNRTS